MSDEPTVNVSGDDPEVNVEPVKADDRHDENGDLQDTDTADGGGDDYAETEEGDEPTS